VGTSGLEGLISKEKMESHPILAYNDYRNLLASCQIALLPLQKGEPQACKTPIKWMEAAVESVAVVAGPELYGPYLENGRYGLTAQSLNEIVPLARLLANSSQLREDIVRRSRVRVQDFALEKLLPWRITLYRNLLRLSKTLDRSLDQRFPLKNGLIS